PTFARIARTLLQNVLGAAGTCSLDTTMPIAVVTGFDFGFWVHITGRAAGGGRLEASTRVQGRLTTTGYPDTRDRFPVHGFYLQCPSGVLSETVTRRNPATGRASRVRYTVTLRFSKPKLLFDYPDYSISMAVKVKSSNDPSCPPGSK